ncbi:MAG: hypothetical protein ACRD5G_09190 [Candidatus Acidiferrales bacterium]
MIRFIFCMAMSTVVLAAFGNAGPQPPQPRAWNFDKDKPGALPQGFVAAAGDWKVAEHARAPSPRHALAQWAKNARPVFNVVLADGADLKDVDLSVRMLALDGQIDQGGGLVWRARDARNYYIARYNPLENNFRVYKVVEGQRTQLHSADIPRSDGWHTIRITMRGDAIECFYDGRKYLEARDTAFPASGKIGLWTKADAQTLFDDLTVSPLR